MYLTAGNGTSVEAPERRITRPDSYEHGSGATCVIRDVAAVGLTLHFCRAMSLRGGRASTSWTLFIKPNANPALFRRGKRRCRGGNMGGK